MILVARQARESAEARQSGRKSTLLKSLIHSVIPTYHDFSPHRKHHVYSLFLTFHANYEEISRYRLLSCNHKIHKQNY
uniref:Uncharacterized protein n=1 Tax=Arundo donax TaxID=35708 RepID=A0A0A8ZP18_ARUDO